MRRGNNLSPQELDLLTRTIIGEASNQPDEGQAGVAYSVLNRLKSGSFGNTAADVILAPKQYEPWTTRSRELLSIPKDSPAYQRAYGIAQGAVSGEIPDPTDGATHFLQEETVRQRRGGSLPDWAQGQGLKIGDHTFFNPDQGRAMAMNKEEVPDYLGAFIKSSGAASTTAKATTQEDIPDYLGSYIKAQESQQPKPAFVPPASNIPVPDMRSDPNSPQYTGKPIGPGDQGPSEFQERTLNPILNMQKGAGIVAKDYTNRLTELAGQNAGLAGEGLTDISQNRTATGVGKTALGALGYVMSPFGAVDKPIEKMTGNKEFGERAAMLFPSSGAGKVANAYRPQVMAVRDLIKDIGAENIPSVIKRMESNPNLTLMDVAPAVRGNAAGLATDPRNVPAMTHLNEFQKERMAGRRGDAVNIFEDSLGPTPNMAKTVDELKQASVDVGKKMIEPAIEAAAPIPVKSLTRSIDRMIASPEAIAGETPRIPLDPTQIRLLQLRKQITSGEAAPLNERVKFSIDPINEAIKIGGMSEARLGDFTEARRLLNSARRGNTSEEELLSGLKSLAKKQKIVGPIDDAVTMITKGPTEYRSADFVHGLQSRLREEASNLSKSATGSDRNMAHSLHDARDNLVEHIDKASGGAYRPALKQYAGTKEIDEGFKEGFNIFSNPSGAEAMIANHPDMWKKWMESAPEPVKKAVEKGILFGANNKIMNTRRGMDVPENSYAHERISSVVGNKKADDIVRRLGDWRDISETDNLLIKNSATAMRQAGQENRAVREPRSGHDILQNLMPAAVVGGAAHLASGGNPILSAIAGGTAIAGGKLANIAGKAHDIASNKAYAQWASATGQKKQDLIEIMRQAASRDSEPGILKLIPPSILQALPR